MVLEYVKIVVPRLATVVVIAKGAVENEVACDEAGLWCREEASIVMLGGRVPVTANLAEVSVVSGVSGTSIAVRSAQTAE